MAAKTEAAKQLKERAFAAEKRRDDERAYVAALKAEKPTNDETLTIARQLADDGLKADSGKRLVFRDGTGVDQLIWIARPGKGQAADIALATLVKRGLQPDEILRKIEKIEEKIKLSETRPRLKETNRITVMPTQGLNQTDYAATARVREVMFGKEAENARIEFLTELAAGNGIGMPDKDGKGGGEAWEEIALNVGVEGRVNADGTIYVNGKKLRLFRPGKVTSTQDIARRGMNGGGATTRGTQAKPSTGRWMNWRSKPANWTAKYRGCRRRKKTRWWRTLSGS